MLASQSLAPKLPRNSHQMGQRSETSFQSPLNSIKSNVSEVGRCNHTEKMFPWDAARSNFTRLAPISRQRTSAANHALSGSIHDPLFLDCGAPAAAVEKIKLACGSQKASSYGSNRNLTRTPPMRSWAHQSASDAVLSARAMSASRWPLSLSVWPVPLLLGKRESADDLRPCTPWRRAR